MRVVAIQTRMPEQRHRVLTAGYALFQAANNTAVMSGVAADQRGVVSGVLIGTPAVTVIANALGATWLNSN